MFATVRNRRGVVTAVEPCDGHNGRLNLVHIDYKDDQRPHQKILTWEVEPGRIPIEPTALSDISGAGASSGEATTVAISRHSARGG
jgi:hypothetical protein